MIDRQQMLIKVARQDKSASLVANIVLADRMTKLAHKEAIRGFIAAKAMNKKADFSDFLNKAWSNAKDWWKDDANKAGLAGGALGALGTYGLTGLVPGLKDNTALRLALSGAGGYAGLKGGQAAWNTALSRGTAAGQEQQAKQDAQALKDREEEWNAERERLNNGYNDLEAKSRADLAAAKAKGIADVDAAKAQGARDLEAANAAAAKAMQEAQSGWAKTEEGYKNQMAGLQADAAKAAEGYETRINNLNTVNNSMQEQLANQNSEIAKLNRTLHGEADPDQIAEMKGRLAQGDSEFNNAIQTEANARLLREVQADLNQTTGMLDRQKALNALGLVNQRIELETDPKQKAALEAVKQELIKRMPDAYDPTADRMLSMQIEQAEQRAAEAARRGYTATAKKYKDQADKLKAEQTSRNRARNSNGSRLSGGLFPGM